MAEKATNSVLRGPSALRFYGRDLGSKFSAPQIVSRLHAKPDIAAIAAELSDAQCHFRRHTGCSGEHTTQRLTLDMHLSRGACNGHVKSGKNIFSQDFGGMNGRTVLAFSCHGSRF
jgi:hypothetical protein